MKSRLLNWLGTGVFFLVTGTAANAETVAFSTDFNSGVPTELSGVTNLASVGSYSGIGGFSGDFLWNDAFGDPASPTTLTLTGLPPHDSVGLYFLLAVIDSWDGNNVTWGPDYFNVTVDGVSVFSETITVFTDQSDPGTDQSYQPLPQVILSEDPLAFSMQFDPAFTFPHTANTLTIQWFASGGGWQGGGDESWAIDNLQVVLDPQAAATSAVSVPTMSVWGLCILAILLSIIGIRRSIRQI